jgi:nucleotide-binding universal stress UspA family protein
VAQKILIALDKSEAAWRAVEYVAQSFGHVTGVDVTLIHVFPEPPPALWEEGHILNEEEKKHQRHLTEAWNKEHRKRWDQLFNKAEKLLVAAGIPIKAIAIDFKPGYTDIAEEIVEEARKGGYSTLVIGRGELGTIKNILPGSVTSKVIHQAHDIAVTIVD